MIRDMWYVLIYTVDWTTVLVALIAGLPAAITAFAGILMIFKKQDKIHAMLNGHLTKLTDEITQLNLDEIRRLNESLRLKNIQIGILNNEKNNKTGGSK